ncbi:beta-amyrin 28-monooxygenase-like [Rhododendron vialii]|uniref:beta-amyrin 28-monooxygenase-like n=1 Tax=Rhododendron vialii TaxID=182163 RepID=UPI00265F8A9D|nr:beta-amyrin 28-monooxygenase-like [Rhododendron vialii]
MVILCGAEGNEFLFSNEGKVVQVWFPSAISKVFPKPKDESMHESAIKVRKILVPFLKADALHKYIAIMDSVIKQHLETYWNGKEVVKVSDVAPRYTIAMACRLLLSIEDPKKFEKLGKQIGDVVEGTMSLPITFLGTAFHSSIKASQAVRKELTGVITQRKIDLSEKRVSPTQDVLSQMLMASDENEIPHVYNEVLREQLEIAISKEAKVLLNWEDISKMRYSWNVANEVLRRRPPSFGTFRKAIIEFTYSGYKIPKGLKLPWMC